MSIRTEQNFFVPIDKKLFKGRRLVKLLRRGITFYEVGGNYEVDFIKFADPSKCLLRNDEFFLCIGISEESRIAQSILHIFRPVLRIPFEFLSRLC